METTLSNIFIALGFIVISIALLFAVIVAVFDIDFFFNKASRVLVCIAIGFIVIGLISGIIGSF